MLLIKNAQVYAPEYLGKKDILLGEGKILSVADQIEINRSICESWDAGGKTITPGIIDQHIHLTGAGGKHGFASRTPEIRASELLACGTTTVVGLLGTDGSTQTIRGLYAKVKSLESQGVSAYMLTGFFGLESIHLMPSLQDEMVFIDKVLGCKIALSDIRSSYPTELELLRLLRQVRTGGMIAGKKGILHIHLGNLSAGMDILFRLVEEYSFPIAHISPTHVARTRDLFDQAIEFARMGGMIDITTGATKYTDPWRAVLYALDKGIPIDRISFSSDGHAGLDKLDENGNFIGFRKAPFDQNLAEIVALVKEGGIDLSEAIRIITSNPADNLGLKHKGRIKVGADADLCCFDENLQLTDVVTGGVKAVANSTLLMKDSFD